MTTPRASSPHSLAFRVRKRAIDSSLHESAVSASTYTVPAGFMGIADGVTLAMVALIAWRVMPVLQWLSAAERLGRLPGVSWLALPPASAATGLPQLGEIVWIPLVMIPVTLLAVQMLGGYRPVLEQSRSRIWLASVGAPMFGVSVVTFIIIAVRNQHTSRALLFSLALLSAVGLLACRKAVRYYKVRRLEAGHYARNIVIIAAADERPSLMAHFATKVSPHFYRLKGFLDVEKGSRPAADSGGPHASTDDPPVLGCVDDLGALLIHQPIHEVVALSRPGAETWLEQAIEDCEYFQVTFRLVPAMLLSSRARDWTSQLGRGPLNLPEIVLRPGFLDSDKLFVKRLFDIVVSAALLTLLSPLFLLIAIAIKITTPQLPVFYPWRVIGYKGRPFTGYKFTTMYADAEARMEQLRHLNEMQGPVFKMTADPRVTPLGRVLRKFSLNELPQLWSVLTGDMSLVGPRPAYPNELARYELWQKRKLCVQPGMTCLWQVRGRNKISSFDDWVRMDFEYIDNWSLWLDCRILIRTAWAVFAGTGL